MARALRRFWRRLRAEAAEAWADTNRANTLLAERRQTWRSTTAMRWVNTAQGPRLVGAVLPTGGPPSGH
jgi:hypothetical protein